MHVHVSALAGLIVAAYVLLTLFAMRFVSATWPESAVAKAFGALN